MPSRVTELTIAAVGTQVATQSVVRFIRGAMKSGFRMWVFGVILALGSELNAQTDESKDSKRGSDKKEKVQILVVEKKRQEIRNGKGVRKPDKEVQPNN